MNGADTTKNANPLADSGISSSPWLVLSPEIAPGDVEVRTGERPEANSERVAPSGSTASSPPAQPACGLLCLLTSPCHVPSSIPDHNSSKPLEDAPDHFVADGQQSNKVRMALPLLDVTEVGSEEMDLGYEAMPLLDLSQVGSEEMDPGHQVLDHDGLWEDEIPSVGMRFEQLDGYRGSLVKASTQKNRISVAGCKARIYVKFDKET
ncbi:hypothetical protein AHAS_Ahas14G0212600 [Arachis hypogaea]